jgi:hypothetical protein
MRLYAHHDQGASVSVKFGGQSYHFQCPVCDAAIKWSALLRSAEQRISAITGQHEGLCPAVTVDPARLRRLTRDQALSEAARLRAAGADEQ